MDALTLPAAQAHPAHLARKVLAAGATGRAAVIVACRAELAWSVARFRRDSPSAHITSDMAPRLPVEQAAAAVLNVWGHLQPVEDRLVRCWQRMHAQRRNGWISSAGQTEEDLRWYLAERRKLLPKLAAAIEGYYSKRAAADGEVG